MNKQAFRALPVLFGLLAAAPAMADAITDWNAKAGDIVVEAKLSPTHGNRILALAHTAMYEATNAVTRRYPADAMQPQAPRGASVEAAIAAASRAILASRLPAQQASIDAAYKAALDAIPDGTAKTAGIEVGEKAAAAVLTARADDSIAVVESYRPLATPGKYVPTALPAGLDWPQRKPWLMSRADQFRPGPPPALDSATWARDYEEIRGLGAKENSKRTPEQTAIAKFWEATQPPIYHAIVRSVANRPDREITRNARLFMAVTEAVDDALIAVFDAKHHHGFWRPITAIRNGDIDGNDGTTRDPSWTPFIETPMHPEYPCAHCIVASTVGTVLKADIGKGATPRLTSTSPTSNTTRTWTSVDDFVSEVSEGRIYDGVHFRNSTEIGAAMGRQIGGLAVAKYLRKP